MGVGVKGGVPEADGVPDAEGVGLAVAVLVVEGEGVGLAVSLYAHSTTRDSDPGLPSTAPKNSYSLGDPGLVYPFKYSG